MTGGEVGSVSIVVPAYNHARYLPRAIDSLLAQDYPDLEIIVLDDGSTDETATVLEQYTGRLHWERHDNMGQAATLNRGWAMARGIFLGYLSADDSLDSTAVSTAAAALVADRDTVLVYPDYRLLDVNDDVIKTVRAPEFDYENMLATWRCAPGPGALFRRDAAQAAGFWDTDLKLSPDYAFWLRLGLQGTCRRIPEVLAGFRVHNGSQTFGAVSAAQSEEYISVTMDYYSRPGVQPSAQRVRAQALSSAYLMTARSHLRSGRYRTGLERAAAGLRLHPGHLRPRTAKLILHGVLAHRRFSSRTTNPIAKRA